MRNAHASTLTSTLLFPKGGASSGNFNSGRPRATSTLGVASLNGSRPSQPDPNGSVRVSFPVERARQQQLKLAAIKLGIRTRELLARALDHYLDTVVRAEIGGACYCVGQPRRVGSAVSLADATPGGAPGYLATDERA
jgi:hypothetical protein